ncbi:unnamed protein product, partial [Owenia fusiformis]
PMMPVSGDEITKHISRCSVCQSPGPLLTVHSQSEDVPQCPSGWSEMWTGYSFVMHAVGATAGGQQLASPGSCLEDFRARPYIECNSKGECHYFSDKHSFWLVTMGVEPFETKVIPDTLKNIRLRDKIGRCKVCVLNPQLMDFTITQPDPVTST